MCAVYALLQLFVMWRKLSDFFFFFFSPFIRINHTSPVLPMHYWLNERIMHGAKEKKEKRMKRKEKRVK